MPFISAASRSGKRIGMPMTAVSPYPARLEIAVIARCAKS